MLLTTVGIGVAVSRRGQSRRRSSLRGPADGGGVPRDGLACPPQAYGRALLPADRGATARLLTDQRRFLQDAAHQLRTPITIALGHAELQAGRAGRATSRRPRTSRSSWASCTGSRRISERLLIIAAAADPAFLHPEPVALDQLVTELVRRWRPAARPALADRQLLLDSVTVPADRERLSLALDALIENAVRGIPGRETSSRCQPSGTTRAWRHWIIIADTGSGISPAQIPLIFDRFRTGDGGQNGGTGLGLSLVRAVARAHGGTATVRSAVGKGSEFELTLPALSRPALASTAPGTPGTPGARVGTAANHGAEDQGSGRR